MSAVKKEKNLSAFEKKKQTPYACGRCGTRFPVNVERRRYAIVPLAQLRDLQNKLGRSRNEQVKLSGKIANLEDDKKKMKQVLKSSKEEADIKQLENKLNSIEGHVSHLKRDKEELEQRITELSTRQ